MLAGEPFHPAGRATGRLDVAHRVVLTLVKQLSRQLNLGVIIVIHDINMASFCCDRLVALHSGRLLTHGGPNRSTGRP
jgi:iron complex transport system ATP-binding protein